MASPQKENGYTPIANEILEALARQRINSDAWKLIMVIFRKTYGFRKKQDKIALSQFVLATQLTKSAVCRGLNRLKDMNIIIRIANDDCTIYRFNKDFDTWKPLAKLLTLAKQSTSVSYSANASLAKQRHTKETTTKETITKEIYSGQSPQDIDKLIKVFSRINPTIKWGNTTSRKSAANLIKRFGLENTLKMAEQIVGVQGKRYAPTCTTPYQMEEKLAQFKIYFDKEKPSGIIEIK